MLLFRPIEDVPFKVTQPKPSWYSFSGFTDIDIEDVRRNSEAQRSVCLVPPRIQLKYNRWADQDVLSESRETYPNTKLDSERGPLGFSMINPNTGTSFADELLEERCVVRTYSDESLVSLRDDHGGARISDASKSAMEQFIRQVPFHSTKAHAYSHYLGVANDDSMHWQKLTWKQRVGLTFQLEEAVASDEKFQTKLRQILDPLLRGCNKDSVCTSGSTITRRSNSFSSSSVAVAQPKKARNHSFCVARNISSIHPVEQTSECSFGNYKQVPREKHFVEENVFVQLYPESVKSLELACEQAVKDEDGDPFQIKDYHGALVGRLVNSSLHGRYLLGGFGDSSLFASQYEKCYET